MRRYLTTEQAAAYLGTTPAALYMRIHRGTIEFVRYGKRGVRFDVRKLDAEMQRGTQEALDAR